MIHPTIDPAREALVRQVDGVPDRPAKVCSKCGHPKPLDEFGPCARAADGLRSQCRYCDRIDEFVRYHEGGGKERAAAYRSTPEYRARNRERAKAHREQHTEAVRAYRKTPKGRLVHGRSGAVRDLKRTTSDAGRAQISARIALYDAEIARLDRLRDVEQEPVDYRGVSPQPDGRFEVSVYVAGRGTVYGGRFGSIEDARVRADALAFEHTGVRDYAKPKRLRGTR